MKLHEIDEDDPTINLTPMIDVVFTLLVFFMLATKFAERERELDVQLPAASAANEPAVTPEELVINVSRDGKVSIDGRALQGESLSRALSDAAQRAPGIPVTVRGDRRGAYDDIVQVLNECMRAGLSNLSLTTLEGS
jgi:biopolymer transport protein ExbD